MTEEEFFKQEFFRVIDMELMNPSKQETKEEGVCIMEEEKYGFEAMKAGFTVIDRDYYDINEFCRFDGTTKSAMLYYLIACSYTGVDRGLPNDGGDYANKNFLEDGKIVSCLLPKRIAEVYEISLSTVYRTINNLCKDGFISKIYDPLDKKLTYYHLGNIGDDKELFYDKIWSSKMK